METLQEHQGRRLWVGCAAPLLCLPWARDSWAAGLQGVKLSPVVGSGQLSPERGGGTVRMPSRVGLSTEHPIESGGNAASESGGVPVRPREGG